MSESDFSFEVSNSALKSSTEGFSVTVESG